MRSVATVTRISKFEIPYLVAFIEYYIDVHHVDRMFLLVQPAEDIEPIRSYLKPRIGNRIQSIQFLRGRGSIWLNDSTQQILSKVTQDYMLMVDADEFLYLNGESLHRYAQSLTDSLLSQSIVYFSWLVAQSDHVEQPALRYQDEKGLEFGNWDSPTKYLVKRNHVRSLREHYCQTNRFSFGLLHKSDPVRHWTRQRLIQKSRARNHCVVHFKSRSFEETLLKSTQSNIFGSKTEDLAGAKFQQAKIIRQEIRSGALPNRLRGLAEFKSKKCEIEIPVALAELTPIDTSYEKKLLAELGFDAQSVQKFFAVYSNVKNSISPA